MIGSTRLAAVLLLVTGTLASAGAAAANVPLPDGVTAVPVSAGTLTGHIDDDLSYKQTAYGTISGIVTDAVTGKPILDVRVFADPHSLRNTYTENNTYTDANGHYTLTLPAKKHGYALCAYFTDTTEHEANYPTYPYRTYAGRCQGGVAWVGGTSTPQGATRVPLTANEDKTGVDFSLSRGAAITGVLRGRDGRPAYGASVVARSLSNHSIVATTRAGLYPNERSGRYVIEGLPPARAGYEVCFDGSPWFNRSSGGGDFGQDDYGYARSCHRDVPWHDGGLPARATPVHVRAGHVTKHIDATLGRAAAILGRVVGAKDGRDVGGADVQIYSRGGTLLAKTTTDDNGSFDVRGLNAASADHVCASTARGVVSRGVGSYLPACYAGAAWSGSGAPSSASPVRLTRAHLTRITLRLPSGATIDGTVRNADHSHTFASVQIYSAFGRPQGRPGYADEHGRFHVVGLRARDAGYVVCANSFSDRFSAADDAPNCAGSTGWDGDAESLPTDATRFALGKGERKTGVVITLVSGSGGIGGHLTNTFLHEPVADTTIEVYNHAGHLVYSTYTGGDYEIGGLAPSADGYYVCFPGSAIRNVGGGFDPQCYKHVPWPERKAQQYSYR